jgi:hypothetical protein
MLRLKLSGWTYREIGQAAGVSRQRIQQVVQAPPIVRSLIIQRDGGKCQSCDLTVGSKGHVHHKTASKGWDDLDGLILLCVSCHMKAHSAYGPQLRFGVYTLNGRKAPLRRIMSTSGDLIERTLECGHVVSAKVSYLPRRMRCQSCAYSLGV